MQTWPASPRVAASQPEKFVSGGFLAKKALRSLLMDAHMASISACSCITTSKICQWGLLWQALKSRMMDAHIASITAYQLAEIPEQR